MAGTPGTHGIVEVTTRLLATDLPREYIVNHFAVDSISTSVTDANWQALADAFKNFHFATTGTHVNFGNSYGGFVNVYARADAKPRPERGHSVFTPSTWSTSITQPRQICTRLSMYALRNLKRQRGGPYLPIESGSTVSERISTAYMTRVLQYGVQLNVLLLAMNPSWQLDIWSDADNTNHPVQNFWVNDVWDVQRRRAPKELIRQHVP